MRELRVATIVLCACILAACGSPSDSIKFAAPKKFGEPKSMFGMMQIWTTPNEREVVMLMKLPVAADPKHALQGSTFKDAQLKKQQSIKICGNQPASYISLLKPQQHQQLDAIMTVAGGSTYMAMYGYPVGSKPDPQAESAIRNLCAK
ncbi:MAG: hypothetical protein GIW97_04340 [Candidatus Eremiobacteraeota bacterium]|nr:hypothetical protein [Candidatus Eremiobacteraeota bacterium]